MTPIMVVPPATGLGQQPNDARLERLVQRGGRLVQQEQTRLRHQGAGQVDALLLAAAEQDRVAVPELARELQPTNSSAACSRASASGTLRR